MKVKSREVEKAREELFANLAIAEEESKNGLGTPFREFLKELEEEIND